EDGIRDRNVTGVQTCALPISLARELAIRRSALEVRAHEPLELLELRGLADEHVLGDRVQLPGERDRLAVRGDDALVDRVEGLQVVLRIGLAEAVVGPAAVGDQTAGGAAGGGA